MAKKPWRMEYNNKTTLREWAEQTIENSNIETESEKMRAYNVAENVINHERGWRGEVSDAWRKMGYTIEDIPDMFV